jgi:hypothetical protein
MKYIFYIFCLIGLSLQTFGQENLSSSRKNIDDERLMAHKLKISNALNAVLAINAVHYADSSSNSADRNYIGLIAQDVQKSFPELISTNEAGYLSIDYAGLTALLTAAMKEQQFLIDQQNQNNERQQYEIDALKEEIKQFKKLINE